MSLLVAVKTDSAKDTSAVPVPALTSANTNALRWVGMGIVALVLGVVVLLLVLLVPTERKWAAVFISVIGAGTVLVLLPLLLAQFERQQDRIERQNREIQLLHAMDTAILSELDIPRLLGVALRNAVRAVDAEAGGIVLFHPRTGKLLAEEYETVGVGALDRSRLRAITRSGHRAPDADWDTVIISLSAGQTRPAATAFSDEAEAALQLRDRRAKEADPVGYLVVARREGTGKRFTPGDEALLQTFREKIDAAVANAHANEAVRDAVLMKAELVREKRVARALSEGLLADIPAQIGDWRFSRRYEPQGEEALVGGDIYDVFAIGEGRWGVMIADVSGKGLAAAQKTAMVKYSLRSYAREHASPAAVLYRLNNALVEETDLTGFVTLLYGVLDERDNHFTYASAGHETPVLVRAEENGFEVLDPTGIVLGAAPDQDYDEHRVLLEPGDGILLYTDGLSEARSKEDGSLLEVEGVIQLLKLLRATPAKATMTDRVWEAITRYTGGKMRDDTALLWMERACTTRETILLLPEVVAATV